jgi:hypothetical protein
MVCLIMMIKYLDSKVAASDKIKRTFISHTDLAGMPVHLGNLLRYN